MLKPLSIVVLSVLTLSSHAFARPTDIPSVQMVSCESYGPLREQDLGELLSTDLALGGDKRCQSVGYQIDAVEIDPATPNTVSLIADAQSLTDPALMLSVTFKTPSGASEFETLLEMGRISSIALAPGAGRRADLSVVGGQNVLLTVDQLVVQFKK